VAGAIVAGVLLGGAVVGALRRLEVRRLLPADIGTTLDGLTARLADLGIRSELPQWPLLPLIFLVGGAAWGLGVDRLSRTGNALRMAIAGGLSYAASATLIALNANALDSALDQVPAQVSREAGLALVLGAAVFAVSVVHGLALGAAAHAEEGALPVGGVGAAAAVIASIAAVLGMQWLGAGAGDPADTPALERTTLVAAFAGACAFGATSGLLLADLSRRRRRGVARGTARAGVSRRR
jgi:hypothetical protein